MEVQTRPLNPLLARITIGPAIRHGNPCIRGWRYPVETMLELLSSGVTVDDIHAGTAFQRVCPRWRPFVHSPQVLTLYGLSRKKAPVQRGVGSSRWTVLSVASTSNGSKTDLCVIEAKDVLEGTIPGR